MGSGCYDATAFSEAVASAHSVFQVAEELGFNFDLLDIGGGFPGQWSDKITFKEVGFIPMSFNIYFTWLSVWFQIKNATLGY